MKKNTLKIILRVLFVISLFSSYVFSAEEIQSENCSIIAINSAVALANHGDIVKIPAGNCIWDTRVIGGSGTVMIDKEITVIGAGSDGSGTNITITGSDKKTFNNGDIVLAANNIRFSGLSFTTNTTGSYLIWMLGVNSRVDHCVFKGFKWAITADSKIINSVIDHNEFYGGGVQNAGGIGTTRWSEESDLGKENFLFIEDNIFSDLFSLEKMSRPILTYSGARVVIRYNIIKLESEVIGKRGMSDHILDAHGYGHATDLNNGRGTRVFEIYNNSVIKTSITPCGVSDMYCGTAVRLRSGTGVIFNNSWLSDNTYARGASIDMYDWRANSTGDSTGGSVTYATNPNTSGAYYCWSNGYRLKISNTLSSYSNKTIVGAQSGASAIIRGYDSLKYLYFTAISNASFKAGESLRIDGVVVATAITNSVSYTGEGYPCVDQVGRGKNQSAEPVYIWGNKDQYGNITRGSTNAMTEGYIEEGRDYIFTGKPGYTPYRYPHPLTLPKTPKGLLMN